MGTFQFPTPLSEEELRFVPEPLGEFESLLAEQLASQNLDFPEVDPDEADVAAILAQQDAALAGFDEETTEATTVAPEFAQTEEAELAAEIEPAGQEADNALTEFNGFIVIPPAPIDTGSGGGGGGGGCDPNLDPNCPCPPGQIRLPDGTCGVPLIE